jgi:acetyl esterase/lipase
MTRRRRRIVAAVLIALLGVAAVVVARLPAVRSFGAGRGVQARLDVPYVGGSADPKQFLDLYVPPHPDPALPAVLFVHGGWWSGGDRRYLPLLTGLYGNAGRALADRGYVVAVTSYRLFPQAGLDQMLDDVAGAARWTLAHGTAGGGPARGLVLVGHSAGAHLITALATDPARLRANGVDPAAISGVVALSGVYDIAATIPLVDEKLRDEVFGPLFSADPARQRAASPLFRFGPDMPPTLFLVGGEDYPASRRGFDDARHALEGHAAFDTIAGNTHEDMVLELGTADDEVTPRIDAFVRQRAGASSNEVPGSGRQ